MTNYFACLILYKFLWAVKNYGCDYVDALCVLLFPTITSAEVEMVCRPNNINLLWILWTATFVAGCLVLTLKEEFLSLVCMYTCLTSHRNHEEQQLSFSCKFLCHSDTFLNFIHVTRWNDDYTLKGEQIIECLYFCFCFFKSPVTFIIMCSPYWRHFFYSVIFYSEANERHVTWW